MNPKKKTEVIVHPFLVTSTGLKAELRLTYATGVAGVRVRPPNPLLAISENFTNLFVFSR